MKKLLALLLCCLILSGCAGEPVETSEPLPVTQPEPMETQMQESSDLPLNIFVPDENAENFNTIPMVISEQDAQLVLRLLIECSMLEEDMQLNSAHLEGEQLNLDFNEAFRDQLSSYGTAGERMMIGCVVNTFLSIYEAETVYITVNGSIVESGHVIYDFPMGFFE